MERLSLSAWWLGGILLVCLLARAWRRRLYAKYPFFYAYIWTVAVNDAIIHYLYARAPGMLRAGWWISEFVTAIVGFGVTWEIFQQVLLPYRGVLRMARAILAALFSIVLVKAAAEWSRLPLRVMMPTTNEIERNLRVLQVLLLLVVVALIVHYALPMGRNVRLMLIGYGSYLGFHVVLLSLRSEWGAAFDPTQGVLQSSCYCVTLVVWCIGMWSYHDNPGFSVSLERDYERLSRQTTRALQRLRSHLIESWRA